MGVDIAIQTAGILGDIPGLLGAGSEIGKLSHVLDRRFAPTSPGRFNQRSHSPDRVCRNRLRRASQIGWLARRARRATWIASVACILPGWSWLMLIMIGRPDLMYEPPPTPANADTAQRRLRAITVAGYVLQAFTLCGSIAFILSWAVYK